MAAALVLTVITGIDYVYRALTLRRTSARAMQAAAARRAAGGDQAPGEARRDTPRELGGPPAGNGGPAARRAAGPRARPWRPPSP